MTKTLPYYGGKMQLARRIAELVGNGHKHYIEPFAGSAAVLLAMPPATMESINDLDNEVYNFWCVLREHPDALIARLRRTPYAKAEYLSSTFTGDSLERARQFVVRSTQSFSARHQAGYGPSSPRKGTSRASAFVRLVEERLTRMAERLRTVEVERMDAIEFLQRWDDQRTTAYVDPPYLFSLRKDPHGYRTDAGSEEYHASLLDLLIRFSGRVVLSGYESDLYTEKLDANRWTLHRIDVSAPSGNRRDKAVRRMECLWVKEAN